jgi:GNAT superfamily N-acetyltransferase
LTGVMDASSAHVRPATRADVPGIVSVSNSSTLPGEDLGFGGGMESPFHDVSTLVAVRQDPNLVQGEAVWVAEMGNRIVGCVTVEDRGCELELVNIDVPLQLQGRGVGTHLVRSLEERAKAEGNERLPSAQVATRKAWLGSRFPGGNTWGTGSLTKRRTHGPGQSGRGSARCECGRISRPYELP